MLRFLIGFTALFGVIAGVAYASHNIMVDDGSTVPLAAGAPVEKTAKHEAKTAKAAAKRQRAQSAALVRALNRVCVQARKDVAPLHAWVKAAKTPIQLADALAQLIPLNAEINGRIVGVSFPRHARSHQKQLRRLFDNDERGLRYLVQAIRRRDSLATSDAQSALTSVAAREDSVFQQLGAARCTSSAQA